MVTASQPCPNKVGNLACLGMLQKQNKVSLILTMWESNELIFGCIVYSHQAQSFTSSDRKRLVSDDEDDCQVQKAFEFQ